MATRRELREQMRDQFGGFLTISQTAAYIGCDPRTAKKFILEHELEPVRIGGRWKYSAIDLARCLALN